MGKLTGKITIIGSLLAVFTVMVQTPVATAQEDNWENVLNEIQEQIDQLNSLTSELSSNYSDISERLENLRSFIDNLVGASALGRDISVYAVTSDGFTPVIPINSSSLFLENFSPVYTSEDMLTLWVLDSDTQMPLDGTLSIGVSPYASNDGNSWALMMMLQYGSQSIFTFPINDGVVTLPVMSGFGSTWMATISAEDHKNFQFLIKIGESPPSEVPVIVTATSLVPGEQSVITATKNGEIFPGTIILPDGTEVSGGTATFTVPETDSFTVIVKDGNKVVATKKFYTEWSAPEATSAGSDAALVVMSGLLSLFLIYYVYKRRKGEHIFGFSPKKSYPR